MGIGSRATGCRTKEALRIGKTQILYLACYSLLFTDAVGVSDGLHFSGPDKFPNLCHRTFGSLELTLIHEYLCSITC